MVKPKTRFFKLRQARPIFFGGLEQRVGPHNIGLNELSRTIDGAIDVALCGKVHHTIWRVLGKESRYLTRIADVDFFEMVARVSRSKPK